MLAVNGVWAVFYEGKDSISGPSLEEIEGTNAVWERRFAS